MRIHFCAAAFAIGAGFYCGITTVEWCLITFCCVTVIATEGINTALEHIADRVHPELHRSDGRLHAQMAREAGSTQQPAREA